jgi:hypothetical protein
MSNENQKTEAKDVPILRGIKATVMGLKGVDEGFIQRLRYSSTFSFLGGREAGF